MSKKKSPTKESKEELFKKIIERHYNKAQEQSNQILNDKYSVPQFVVDICMELNEHLKIKFEDLLMLEMKASVQHDYVKSFSSMCNEFFQKSK